MLTPRYYPYLAILLIFSVYGLLKFRHYTPKFKVLVVLFLVVLSSEISSRIVGHSIGNTNPSYHFLIPIMSILFGIMFKDLSRSITITVGIVIASGSILLSVFRDPLLSFPSLAFILMALFIVSLSLFDFLQLLRFPAETNLFKTPRLWLNTGNIFFYTFTFFVFGLRNIDMEALPMWIYDLIFFANIALYTIYGWSLVLAARHTNEKGRHFTN